MLWGQSRCVGLLETEWVARLCNPALPYIHVTLRVVTAWSQQAMIVMIFLGPTEQDFTTVLGSACVRSLNSKGGSFLCETNFATKHCHILEPIDTKRTSTLALLSHRHPAPPRGPQRNFKRRWKRQRKLSFISHHLLSNLRPPNKYYPALYYSFSWVVCGSCEISLPTTCSFLSSRMCTILWSIFTISQSCLQMCSTSDSAIIDKYHTGPYYSQSPLQFLSGHYN